ncbi:MAG: MFS transporter, partial [Gordonia sp. (in: high G+C Gram-positive bacteria)]
VEGRPRVEWPDRFGWMRMAFGLGQISGLGVAAFFAHRLTTGWTVVGMVVFAGALFGALRLPRLQARTRQRPLRRSRLAALRATVGGRFGALLLAWLFAMIGLMTFNNVVPLVLQASFGTSPADTSLYLLAGAVCATVLYPVCGRLCDRFSSACVLAAGAIITFAAFVVMAVAGSAGLSSGAAIGSVCLVLIAAVYPLQYVGATLQAAKTAPGGEGAALGLFNSAVAAGAVIGAVGPSFLAHAVGYSALPWFSVGSLLIAAVFGVLLLMSGRRLRRAQPAS